MVFTVAIIMECDRYRIKSSAVSFNVMKYVVLEWEVMECNIFFGKRSNLAAVGPQMYVDNG